MIGFVDSDTESGLARTAIARGSRLPCGGMAVIATLSLLLAGAVLWLRSNELADDAVTELFLRDPSMPHPSALPAVVERCRWVREHMLRANSNRTHDFLKKKFQLQASDPNMFYRGVDYIFWHDMVRGGWGEFNLSIVAGTNLHMEGFSRPSAWTWITGDQHLSNFGAWKNRNDDIVFGVNDFDEAVVYDFQMDIWRLAVSMYDHALTNGIGDDGAMEAVNTFAIKYIDTVVSYIGNEVAMVHEVTLRNAKGKLEHFLKKVSRSTHLKQLEDFTTRNASGARSFVFNNKTMLEPAPARVAEEFRRVWTAEGYGATLNKVGWREREWNDDYFQIVDLAVRLESGDGSYGVDRYYVLIQAQENLLSHNADVILDVKATVQPAMRSVVSKADAAWYDTLFVTEASRAVKAQRRLTSYTDPFTGWVRLFDDVFVVRQRSPWKASFPIEELDTQSKFNEFVEQVAVVTATSHTRGTFGKSPAQFKEVIKLSIGDKGPRDAWAARVTDLARMYRQQVLSDYKCFKQMVADDFS